MGLPGWGEVGVLGWGRREALEKKAWGLSKKPTGVHPRHSCKSNSLSRGGRRQLEEEEEEEGEAQGRL